MTSPGYSDEMAVELVLSTRKIPPTGSGSHGCQIANRVVRRARRARLEKGLVEGEGGVGTRTCKTEVGRKR